MSTVAARLGSLHTGSLRASTVASRPRSWFLPRATLVELGSTLTRLVIVGLLAIGTSGLIAAAFGSIYGRPFVAGDPPGVTYTDARCTDLSEYAPGASTCEEAATWHHYGEIVQYRVAAGLLGLVVLGVYALLRRRIRGEPGVLPPGFEATVGVAMVLALVYGAILHRVLFHRASSGMAHSSDG